MTQIYRHREESINTQLAILLSRHGVDAEAETIQQSGRNRPDVLFPFRGLRVIIEGKFSDTPKAKETVLKDALRRIQNGICHISVALIYPEYLRTIPTNDFQKVLSRARLRYIIISDTDQTDWIETIPGEILASLRRIHETLVRDDIVAKAARGLSECIDRISELWINQPAICEGLAEILEMLPKRGEKQEERNSRQIAATKVASLVLANAMIFQEQLALSGDNKQINSLRAYDNSHDPIASLKEHWRWIWTKINYVPIFQVGEKILTKIPISLNAINAVRQLISQAKETCANQSALRHDLMGRIYHWLIHNAKYLGTYYTATSSATLLLKLTFSLSWASQDFSSPRKLDSFIVTDLTCGTGTLLMAAAQALADRFIISRAGTGRTLNDTDLGHLHKTLMENVLYGYDVLPSAVHLTASTLGMLAPNVTYRKMNLFVMPMGMSGHTTPRLGSLDFITHRRVRTQLALDDSQLESKQKGTVAEHYVSAEIPTTDLFVMNPPFVRSVGGNLLFGSLPDDERAKLQTELKKRSKGLNASITAGLGSVFIALADKYLKIGGRMAFVLPVALATGEAWGISRKLLADGYHVEMVIVSHDAEHPNFSENTGLSELMFIARKLKKNESAGNTIYVNLLHNPRTIYEAMDIAERVKSNELVKLDKNAIIPVLGSEGHKLAELISLPVTHATDQWMGVQFVQASALRTAVMLSQGKVVIPGKSTVSIPMCELGLLGNLGYDRRDIHDAFTVSKEDWSPYPAFWNHDSKQVVCIRQNPNSFLQPRSVAAPKRKLKDHKNVVLNSGRILLVERVSTTTHRVLAISFSEPTLGNTWWALQTDLSEEREKALLIWLNSTPSLLLMLSRRVTTQGAWMSVKKPAWSTMPVLDVRNLPDNTVRRLADAYERLCSKELMALAKLDVDPIRREIDESLSSSLGLSDIKMLRQILAREPGLTGKNISLEQNRNLVKP